MAAQLALVEHPSEEQEASFRSGLSALRSAALNMSPVSIGVRRTSSPHEFYRYPARFPPGIVSAAIDAFSEPGDLIADYFVGGGTTLVEARLAGRLGVGCDLNSLAAFVTRVKTRIYSGSDLAEIEAWSDRRERVYTRHRHRYLSIPNVDDPRWSEIVALVASSVERLEKIRSAAGRDLARCSILRAAQWALDMRGEIPDIEEFRDALQGILRQNVLAARSASARYRKADRLSGPVRTRRSAMLEGSLSGLESRLRQHGAPDLIVTSPPYPGVYVPYNRWKIRGRLESSLPYAIAGLPEPGGMAQYTMGARADKTQDKYFANLISAFSTVSRLAKPSTWVVQVVGFSDVATQLPRYLEAMRESGLRESTFPEVATDDDGRLWRPVPRRRFWARAGDRVSVAEGTSTEVILFHQRDVGREVN